MTQRSGNDRGWPKIAEDGRKLPAIAVDWRKLPEMAGDCRPLPSEPGQRSFVTNGAYGRLIVQGLTVIPVFPHSKNHPHFNQKSEIDRSTKSTFRPRSGL